MKRGDTISTTCAGCPATITYVLRGKPQIYCADCAAARAVAASKRHYKVSAKRVNLAPNERRGTDPEGLAGVTCMTQEECSARLAVWESLDHKLRTGKFKLIRPMTQQRIQQIEREALIKMRRALRSDYNEIMEDSSRGGEQFVLKEPSAFIEGGETLVERLNLRGLDEARKVSSECQIPYPHGNQKQATITEASPAS